MSARVDSGSATGEPKWQLVALLGPAEICDLSPQVAKAAIDQVEGWTFTTDREAR